MPLLVQCFNLGTTGAQQSGDMLQDLKTGHLLNASPRDQFYAQLLGSLLSCFVTISAYALFTSAYTVRVSGNGIGIAPPQTLTHEV